MLKPSQYVILKLLTEPSTTAVAVAFGTVLFLLILWSTVSIIATLHRRRSISVGLLGLFAIPVTGCAVYLLYNLDGVGSWALGIVAVGLCLGVPCATLLGSCAVIPTLLAFGAFTHAPTETDETTKSSSSSDNTDHPSVPPLQQSRKPAPPPSATALSSPIPPDTKLPPPIQPTHPSPIQPQPPMPPSRLVNSTPPPPPGDSRSTTPHAVTPPPPPVPEFDPMNAPFMPFNSQEGIRQRRPVENPQPAPAPPEQKPQPPPKTEKPTTRLRPKRVPTKPQQKQRSWTHHLVMGVYLVLGWSASVYVYQTAVNFHADMALTHRAIDTFSPVYPHTVQWFAANKGLLKNPGVLSGDELEDAEIFEKNGKHFKKHQEACKERTMQELYSKGGMDMLMLGSRADEGKKQCLSAAASFRHKWRQEITDRPNARRAMKGYMYRFVESLAEEQASSLSVESVMSSFIAKGQKVACKKLSKKNQDVKKSGGFGGLKKLMRIEGGNVPFVDSGVLQGLRNAEAYVCKE